MSKIKMISGSFAIVCLIIAYSYSITSPVLDKAYFWLGMAIFGAIWRAGSFMKQAWLEEHKEEDRK